MIVTYAYARILDLVSPVRRPARHRMGVPAMAILARVNPVRYDRPAPTSRPMGWTVFSVAAVVVAYCMWLVFRIAGLYR